MKIEWSSFKWNNLKINKCPKCDKDFLKGLSTFPIDSYSPAGKVKSRDQMLSHVCGFNIRESRYTQIVNSQVNQDLEDRNNEEEE